MGSGRWGDETGWGGFAPYVPVATRLVNAKREAEKLAKKGRVVSPVKPEGRMIARTFWGKAWCDNLETYSDYSNRLPRGRSYIRNGSVVDLQIEKARVRALVMGSSLYEITIEIGTIPSAPWKRIVAECAGGIDSLVELLQGRLSRGVMEVITRKGTGLFPAPREIKMRCSCPDSAGMCKHIAATMYGVGCRLDAQPELMFLLRGADHTELIKHAGTAVAATKAPVGKHKTVADADLADVFGIEIDGASEAPERAHAAGAKSSAKPGRKAAVAVEAKPAIKAVRSERVSKPVVATAAHREEKSGVGLIATSKRKPNVARADAADVKNARARRAK